MNVVFRKNQVYGHKEMIMNDSTKRILLVDSDEGDSRVLTQRLERLGYEVISAPQESSSAIAVDNPSIDVALVDINMPVESGFRVAEDLTESSDAKVVFISSVKTPTVRNRAKALGASGFIEKPYTGAYLKAQLEQALAP